MTDEIKVLFFLENCIDDPMWPSHFEMHKDKAQTIISIIQKLRAQNYALQVRFDQAIKLLKQNTGLLCESANLNNYRNLSDEELGKAWTETATRTASFLNEIEGIQPLAVRS